MFSLLHILFCKHANNYCLYQTNPFTHHSTARSRIAIAIGIKTYASAFIDSVFYLYKGPMSGPKCLLEKV